MDRDAQHLRWLVLGHYVLAALTVLGALPFIPCATTVALLTRLTHTLLPPELFPREAVAELIRYTLWSVFAMSLVHASVVAYIGWCLAQHRHHLLCLLFSAMNCLMVPFGTALGIFAILVLARPTVKQLFTKPAPKKA
jgi:hypothetical protein